MNIKKYFFALCLSLLIFSCKEDVTSESGISLSGTEMSFYAEGGYQEVEVKAGGDWIAKSNQPWCLISPANGTGNAVCRIQTDHSTRYDGREAVIQFVSGSDIKEIKVSQMGYAPTIKVVKAPEETLPYYKEEQEAYFDVEVEGNVAFNVNIAGETPWVNKMQGTSDKDYAYTPSETRPEKKTFRFHYDINANTEPRTQLIEFVQNIADGIKAEVTVDQDCMEEITPSRKGDSLVVVTLAKLMNVYGTSWDPSRPITHWDNVLTEEINGELRIVGLSLAMFSTDRSIPFHISKLTELRSLELRANDNSHLKSIELGPEITELKKLKSLSLYAYGLNKLPSPENMQKMEALEELNLYANTFMELGTFDKPGTLLHSLEPLKEKLKYLNVSANRRYDGIKSMKDLPFLSYLPVIPGYEKDYQNFGMTGEIEDDIFEFENLEYLSISNNYISGPIPTPTPKDRDVFPNLRNLRFNQNLMSGECPDWIKKHKYRGCWNPDVLIFNQIAGGVDQDGKEARITGTQIDLIPCPNPDDETVNKALNLPQLNKYEQTMGRPLSGNWRYYEYFNLWKNNEVK